MNAEVAKAVEKKELGHAKSGLVDAMFSGILWGLAGVFLWYLALCTGVLNTYAEGITMTLAIVISLIAAMLHDGAASFTVLIKNITAGKAKEYGRALSSKPGKFMIAAGLIGGTFAMSGYVVGMYLCGPTAIILSTGYPAVGAICARIFLKEAIKPRVWAGIFISIAGAVIVGWLPLSFDFPHYWLGVALSFTAMLGWGIEGVICAFGTDMLDPDIAIGIREFTSFLVYLIVAMPLLFVFTGINPFPIIIAALASKAGLFCIVAGICGGSSYLFWYRGSNKTGCARAMAVNVTYALWSLVFAVIGTMLFPDYLASVITKLAVVGAIVMACGAILVVANPKELVNLRNM